MGKPYDKQYFFSGSGTSCATMVCIKCNQPILNKSQDWMAQKKNKNYDWSYQTIHRGCVDDQSEWIKLEKKAKLRNDKARSLLEDLAKVASRHGISDPVEFASSAAYSLGEDDLNGYYFGIYGSG